MASTIGRGIIAGACGTALLHAATYLDMLLTGRAASDAPERAAAAAADRLGVEPPDDPQRMIAYGALGGIATGLGVGVIASGARRVGVRLPAPLGAAATGATAMAVTNASMTALDVIDPTTWSKQDWARDVVPHLAYGIGVRWALDRVEPPPGEPPPAERRRPAGAGLLARCLALGVAAGGRGSLGITVPARATGNPLAARTADALVAAEIAMDKLRSTPSRLAAAPALVRIGSGAAGGLALARREGAAGTLAALFGATGAAAGTLAGAMWREEAERRGLTWQSAVAEDVVALGLTAYAFRGGR